MKIVRINSGLGNQMFQYAFYCALKNKMKNENFIIENGYFKYNNIHNGYELNEIFSISFKSNELINIFFNSENILIKIIRKIFKIVYRAKILQQKNTQYVSDKINLKKNIFIGYWQSEQYFKDIENKIRKIYSFPKLDEKNKRLEEKIKNEESISIHIRRGDYIKHPTLGGLITKEYYIKAIEYIEKYIQNPKYYIFSDDIEWCRRELNLNNREITFINHNKDEESYKYMQLMSQCKHNIIPNSSFSWWGAWLNKNPNKIVIAPKRWFTKESGYRYEDIVPKSWIKIDNEE